MELKIEEGKYYRTQDGRKVGPAKSVPPDGPFGDYTWAMWRSGGCVFEIVGVRPEHAFHTELVSEWTDDTPKTWGEMTDEEKGALLLAEHEGKVIEAWTGSYWYSGTPMWNSYTTYRVKPDPVRETVEIYGCGNEWGQASEPCLEDTHRITFDTIDGKPDCDSIKMEEIVG